MYYLFYELIFDRLFSNAYPLEEYTFLLMNRNCDMCEYISSLMALICTIIVYVCCCLVVLKIIRTVSNVFRG